MPRKYQNKRNQYQREYMRKRGREQKAALVAYKGGICVDCHQAFPSCVFDFDHLRDKKFKIAQRLAQSSFAKLTEEVDKCDLVCANCHRIRTQERINFDLSL
jgi:hypothetical protein